MITKIKNGILIDREEKCGESIYVKNGVILAITAEELPFDQEYDAAGCYVSAGWIDLHTHGGGGADFMDGGADSIIEGAKMHLLHGTTSLYPTTLSASKEALTQAVLDIKEAMSFPTVRGVHLEGPYFDPKSCGAQNTQYIRGFDLDEIEELLSFGVVKRWDFAPELPGSEQVSNMLRKAGVVPAMGHSGATYEELLPAYHQGCKLVTHLYSLTYAVMKDLQTFADGDYDSVIVKQTLKIDDITGPDGIELFRSGSWADYGYLRQDGLDGFQYIVKGNGVTNESGGAVPAETAFKGMKLGQWYTLEFNFGMKSPYQTTITIKDASGNQMMKAIWQDISGRGNLGMVFRTNTTVSMDSKNMQVIGVTGAGNTVIEDRNYKEIAEGP